MPIDIRRMAKKLGKSEDTLRRILNIPKLAPDDEKVLEELRAAATRAEVKTIIEQSRRRFHEMGGAVQRDLLERLADLSETEEDLWDALNTLPPMHSVGIKILDRIIDRADATGATDSAGALRKLWGVITSESTTLYPEQRKRAMQLALGYSESYRAIRRIHRAARSWHERAVADEAVRKLAANFFTLPG